MVDSVFRILWIGGDWDDFAVRNGGNAVLANDVLATRLTDYITDSATQGTVTQMVTAVIDTQSSLRMDYRCDGPEELRLYRLTIKPMKDSRAIMVHELRDAIRLDPPMGEWSFDPAARHHKCSVCGMVQAQDGAWKDPTLPGGHHPALVRYTVCHPCASRIDTAVAGILDGAAAGDVGTLMLKPGSTHI